MEAKHPVRAIVRVVAYSPCPKHGPGPGKTNFSLCNCPKTPEASYVGEGNLLTGRWAQLTQVNIFGGLSVGASVTISAITGSNIVVSPNSALSATTVVAGTSTASASVGDTNLGAQSAGTSGSQAATVNAYSGSGASGSYTVTATVTNSSGASITYAEVGLEVTQGVNTFLVAHDVFPGQPVSNGGTLAVTYTLTNS